MTAVKQFTCLAWTGLGRLRLRGRLKTFHARRKKKLYWVPNEKNTVVAEDDNHHTDRLILFPSVVLKAFV